MGFFRNNGRKPPERLLEGADGTPRLVQKAASGDVDAFGELYVIFMQRIYRYVFHQVNDRMAAEDITEDVFVRAWHAIGSCRGKEHTFSAWLYRIAHNRAVDSMRRQNKQTLLDDDTPDGNNMGVAVESNLERQELLSLIQRLPENQRQVILLKFVDGLENPEIGLIMNKSQGAVRVLQMRALSTLRERLSKET